MFYRHGYISMYKTSTYDTICIFVYIVLQICNFCMFNVLQIALGWYHRLQFANGACAPFAICSWVEPPLHVLHWRLFRFANSQNYVLILCLNIFANLQILQFANPVCKLQSARNAVCKLQFGFANLQIANRPILQLVIIANVHLRIDTLL